MNEAIEAMQYATYIKPSFAPPAWIFGPVWTVLYITIAIAFGWILWRVSKGTLPKRIGVLVLVNLIANFLYTPIQFGLGYFWLAWVDIVIVLFSLLWIQYEMWGRGRSMFWLLLPYTLWVTFATILQTSIAILNS